MSSFPIPSQEALAAAEANSTLQKVEISRNTRACWECKRKRRKCIRPKDNSGSCEGCQLRSLKCIEQSLVPVGDPRLTASSAKTTQSRAPGEYQESQGSQDPEDHGNHAIQEPETDPDVAKPPDLAPAADFASTPPDQETQETITEPWEVEFESMIDVSMLSDYRMPTDQTMLSLPSVLVAGNKRMPGDTPRKRNALTKLHEDPTLYDPESWVGSEWADIELREL